DGYVMHCTLGDWTSLVEWVKGDGKAQDLGEPQWEDQTYRRDHAEHLFDVLDEWATDYSVAELMEGAQLRRIPYAMVRPLEALAGDSRLTPPGFFPRVEPPGLGRASRSPGAPFFPPAAPWRISRRPPVLGEHNQEVYRQELGMSGQQVMELAGAGV